MTVKKTTYKKGPFVQNVLANGKLTIMAGRSKLYVRVLTGGSRWCRQWPSIQTLRNKTLSASNNSCSIVNRRTVKPYLDRRRRKPNRFLLSAVHVQFANNMNNVLCVGMTAVCCSSQHSSDCIKLLGRYPTPVKLSDSIYNRIASLGPPLIIAFIATPSRPTAFPDFCLCMHSNKSSYVVLMTQWLNWMHYECNVYR